MEEIIINDPCATPAVPNTFGNGRFFTHITHTAGGYCFCGDAKYRRITRYRENTVPTDNGGRYFYIKDGDCIWNPGWRPCRTPLDSFECRHGIGSTRIESSKNGVRASLLVFVPLDADAEIHRLTISNLTDAPKTLKLFSYAEWCPWNASKDSDECSTVHRDGQTEIYGSAIFHRSAYDEEGTRHYAFYWVNRDIDGFDTDRNAFLGNHNGYDTPAAVTDGRPRNSVCNGGVSIASHCTELHLQPGESTDLIYVLGYVEIDPSAEKFSNDGHAGTIKGENVRGGLVNKTGAMKITAAFGDVRKVDAAFAALQARWTDILAGLDGPSARDMYEKITALEQIQGEWFTERSGSLERFARTAATVAGICPHLAREKLLWVASHLPERDDPAWFIYAAREYVDASGDLDVLDEESLLDRLKEAFDRPMDDNQSRRELRRNYVTIQEKLADRRDFSITRRISHSQEALRAAKMLGTD